MLQTLHATEFLNSRNVPSAVTSAEAFVIAKLIVEHKCKLCLEVGVANGGSALAIAQATDLFGGRLHGIDPCQLTEHGAAAVRLLENYKLDHVFTLHPQPTHLAAPKLLEEGLSFDFAFVDGMHCFEFKSLDAFYCDRLLRIGGFLAFHDATFDSTKKVLRLLQTTGRFSQVSTPSLHLPIWHKGRRVLGAILRRRRFPFFWMNGFSNLVILKKISDMELPWNHFADF